MAEFITAFRWLWFVWLARKTLFSSGPNVMIPRGTGDGTQTQTLGH